MTGRRSGGTRLPDDVRGGTPESPCLITPELLRRWALPVPTGSKYNRGQAVVVGGAAATPGAAMLAGHAALRMGAGRLTLAVARSVAPHVAVAFPESAAHGLPENEDGSVTGERATEILGKDVANADGLLVGPGLDDPDGTIRLLEELATVVPRRLPVVLDAFGLTVMADVSKECREAFADNLLATPNSNELARLVGEDSIEPEAVPAAAREVAERFGAVVSSNSWIVSVDDAWRVTTGDTGLGTSGSGDVLAGAVLGLVSRGAPREQALAWATHVHAAAGDVLAARFGRIGFLAGELLPELPQVMSALRGD